jgi:DNA-binding NarL/FixJ family response regulator
MSEPVLIAADHPVFRQAIGLAVANVLPAARLIECANLAAALNEAVERKDLALILLELKMLGAEGFAKVGRLHTERPALPILVVSRSDMGLAAPQNMRTGAVCFVGKFSELAQIETSITNALTGKPHAAPPGIATDRFKPRKSPLTPTQLRVMLGVMKGRLNKQIAFDLGVSEATIKAHMTAILSKLEVQNRTQAALAARALGLAAMP